ncbi:MAG: hypothetical protein OER04_20005 [Cyclobacteriaceae bacterium]|nr:hypothetical protein [Cyclobacteriaceae bacterium]
MASNSRLIAAAFLLFTCTNVQGQKTDQYERTTLFDGEIIFSQNDTKRNIPLLVEEFIVDGGQTIEDLELRFEGLLLVQLRGGELYTSGHEDRKERRVSEFWVLQPGEKLNLNTDDDSAILRTYLLGKEYLEIAPEKSLDSRWQKVQGQFKQLADNLYSRESHIIGDPENPLIQVMDINVGPGKTTGSAVLPGAAQIQVISGEEGIRINQDGLKGLGATLTVAEGESITIDNRQGSKPAKFRAIVFLK